jgi:HK97 gp10 family phage protein
MKVETKLSGLDGVLDLLKSLPPEVVSKRGGPVKAALRKGALVIHKAAKANLQQSLSNAPQYSTGLLEKNLVVTRGKEPTGTKGERYLVRVRRKVYEGRSGRSGGGKAVTTLAAAQLLEYGSSQQPAEPWLRPAFNAKAGEAIKTIETELLKGVDRIVKKLAKGR